MFLKHFDGALLWKIENEQFLLIALRVVRNALSGLIKCGFRISDFLFLDGI